MNARLYDPTLGRFLSADTVIHDPYDTQAFNRYSYVRNNPLKYTDPSGHSWLSKIFKIILTIVVTVVAYAVFGPAGSFVGKLLAISGMGLPAVALGAAMGATMGFATTLIYGGSLKDVLLAGVKGAIFGAISAGIAQGIGDWAGVEFFEGNIVKGHAVSFFSKGSFGPALAKASMHGLTRGVITVAQGGKFGAGFASGFVSSGFSVGRTAFSNLTKEAARMARTAVMAMVGGVTSVITGGKFANGAVTGAFVHLFNAEMKPKLMGGITKEIDDKAKYYTKDARMARGLAIHQGMQEYSKPMMAAGATGVVILVGGEIVIVGEQFIATHPAEITSFMQGYNSTTYNVAGNRYYQAGQLTKEFVEWVFR